MKLQLELQNGQFVTCTTRRANFTDIYFGWFTVWESKACFDKGICNNAIEYKNISLGTDKLRLMNNAIEFIHENEQGFNKILQEIK